MDTAPAGAQLSGPDCRVPILMYHDVADAGPPETAPYRLSPAAFRHQMQWLREHGYAPLSLDAWTECVDAGRAPPGRRVVITFDDGYRNLMRNASPILQETGFSATVFVVAGRVGRNVDWDALSGDPPELMDWGELRELQQQGNTIASHCVLHRDLTTLSDAEIAADAAEARAILRRELGREVRMIAYPWGQSDERVRRLLFDGGYRFGVGVTGGASTLADDPLLLPRIEIFGNDDLASFAAKIDATMAAPPLADVLDTHRPDGLIGFAEEPTPAPPPTAPPSTAQPPTAPQEPARQPHRLDQLQSLSQRIDQLIEELTAIRAALARLQQG